MTKRIVSGVQPTGNLHLGNYLGAIRRWVNIQNDAECLFFLADLHAITVAQDPAKLRAAVRETAAAYIACGIDPKKSIIFPQSAVAEHSELAWILGCHTPMGWLNRMTQFKEKAGTSKSDLENLQNILLSQVNEIKKFSEQNANINNCILEGAKKLKAIDKGDTKKFSLEFNEFTKELLNQNLKSIDIANEMLEKFKSSFTDEAYIIDGYENQEKAKLGLYSYPVLMAADILLYKATHVPVGEDQKQHIELARDIAGAFNRDHKVKFFPLPKPMIGEEAARIMSLRDGTKKMSKSDESDYSRINLTDDADTIALKFRKAKSDMVEGMSIAEDRPEASNLLAIYAVLKGISKDQAVSECGELNFSAFKNLITEVAVEKLSPITQKMRELLASPADIDAVLKDGTQRATEIAAKTMNEVKDLIGFIKLT